MLFNVVMLLANFVSVRQTDAVSLQVLKLEEKKIKTPLLVSFCLLLLLMASLEVFLGH